MERPMQKLNDLSRSLTALEPDGTLIAVIEMSLSSWLVAGIVPGEHRRAKTDRLDSELLKRAFLGWLRGERRLSDRAKNDEGKKMRRPA
jgi:transposase